MADRLEDLTLVAALEAAGRSEKDTGCVIAQLVMERDVARGCPRCVEPPDPGQAWADYSEQQR